MGWLSSDETPERRKLAGHLGGDSLRVVRRDQLVKRLPSSAAVAPLAEIQMETHAERRPVLAVRCRRGRRRPPDHQAGAGEDPVLVGADDPAVDSRRAAEVVAVDDEGSLGPCRVTWVAHVTIRVAQPAARLHHASLARAREAVSTGATNRATARSGRAGSSRGGWRTCPLWAASRVVAEARGDSFARSPAAVLVPTRPRARPGRGGRSPHRRPPSPPGRLGARRQGLRQARWRDRTHRAPR